METMRWLEEGLLELLDQTGLPGTVNYLRCSDYHEVATAIKNLSVRGAPAIGAAAAYGLALAAGKIETGSREAYIAELREAAGELAATRPTAVNLCWAVDRVMRRLVGAQSDDPAVLRQVVLDEAHAIHQEDESGNRRMGKYGRELIPQGARILTHCNAGALATAGYGTALGVIRAAREEGKDISVFAGETRPLLQGARLTAWEMCQEGIPVTVITDNMAGYLMAKGMVDLVLVGADRITAGGDVANKIGTYSLAVLAKEHNIPFYVAAPISTVDLSLTSGSEITIEERDMAEVTHLAGQQIAPTGVQVWNPAFDVTPARLVAAIITERGIVRPPYMESIRKIVEG
ncbi:Methylthioribose-1-phosphate isomerase [Pelotomaculum schinkii]|uniref:Methylthioribose-1-phosphate isomerase n=1 Tax=Pelotomaculum schinkii TaxID=78350 RepID=A0A4Y7R970_9FIRM|nr:Methylthioribose-1-phosphate isomerase [Pelotomaculum schinkii]